MAAINTEKSLGYFGVNFCDILFAPLSALIGL